MIIQPSLSGDSRSAAEILSDIAALPSSGGDPFTSRDHDKVLYGGR